MKLKASYTIVSSLRLKASYTIVSSLRLSVETLKKGATTHLVTAAALRSKLLLLPSVCGPVCEKDSLSVCLCL